MFTGEGRLFLKRPDTANLGVWETRSENTRKKRQLFKSLGIILLKMNLKDIGRQKPEKNSFIAVDNSTVQTYF